MKKLTLFFALLLLTSVSLSAQNFSAVVPMNGEFGCLTYIQVVPSTICEGNTALMSAFYADGTPAPSTTKWFLNGVQFATGQNTSVSPQFNTTYETWVPCPDGSNSISNPDVYVVGIAPTLSFQTTPAACGTGGSINLTVMGGVAPYQYFWNTGVTTEDLNNLNQGTYTLTVVTSVGCTKSGSVTVGGGGGSLSLATSQTNVLCNGNNTGAINLSVSGGSGNEIYLWSNGSQNQDPSNLSAGTYTVTVSSGGSCTATTSVTITQPQSALNLSSTTTSASCGTSNGSIDLNVSGGTPGYSYQWSNFCNAVQDPNGLASGTYTVTVTDANGCTKTAMINVGQNNNLPMMTIAPIVLPASGNYTVTITNANGCTGTAILPATVNCPSNQTCNLSASVGVTQVSCFGSATGSVTVTPSGGTAGYIYQWSTGGTNSSISGLMAGNYGVTITDATNATCKMVANAYVSQPSQISLVTLTGSGEVKLGVAGGMPGYTFDWSNNGPQFPDTDAQNLSSVPAGVYCVTVTDANGCTASACATVSGSNPVCNLTVATSAIDASVNGGADGSVWVTSNGGNGNLTYQWSNGANTSDLGNLVAGTYCVTVTDANGCTASACANVNQPPAGCNTTGITNNMSVINGQAFCPPTTQFFLVAPNWGQNGYVFQWSTGGVTFDPWRILASTNSGAHYYEVLVTSPSNEEKLYCFSYTVLCLSGAADERGPEPAIFPNPIGDGECLQVTGLPAGMYNVMITDQSGRIVTKKVVKQ